MAERFLNNIELDRFLNSIVLNMQITLFHFKNDKPYCHCTNKSPNFNNNTNLTLKTDKQKTYYLNYHFKIKMHCGIVWDFTLPKSAICGRIRQCCLIGHSARTDHDLHRLLPWVNNYIIFSLTGYVVEYTAGEFITPSNTWERIDVSGGIPSATVQPLMANTTYHVRVAPRFGNQLGDFSSPPQIFLTPTVPPSGKYTPLEVRTSEECLEVWTSTGSVNFKTSTSLLGIFHVTPMTIELLPN